VSCGLFKVQDSALLKRHSENKDPQWLIGGLIAWGEATGGSPPMSILNDALRSPYYVASYCRMASELERTEGRSWK
jgi:hypothetical protein